MSATTKPDFHPDTESLNAFAEQALAEKDRSQVLAHLAVCGRCRQVIALARESANTEVASPATGRHVAPQHDGWWKRWRLVWVPTATVTAFAVASISIYVHQADQNSATTKIARLSNEQGGAAAANSSRPEQAQAVPPFSPAPAATRPKPDKPTAPGAPQAAHSSKMQPPADLDRPTVANSALKVPPLSAQEQQLNSEQAPAKKSSDSAAPPSQPAMSAFKNDQRQQEERKEENETTLDGIPPANAHLATGVAAATQQVVVTASNPRLELQTESLAGFSSIRSSRAAAKVAVKEAAINLPSGLPAASTAVAGRRMLAIDKEGTLYLSEDAGNTWDHVTRQWTGHAISVRRHAPPGAIAGAMPNAQQLEAAPGDAEGSPVPSPAPAPASESTPAPSSAPAVFFEILNDKNQVWLSTDGRLWTAQ